MLVGLVDAVAGTVAVIWARSSARPDPADRTCLDLERAINRTAAAKQNYVPFLRVTTNSRLARQSIEFPWRFGRRTEPCVHGWPKGGEHMVLGFVAMVQTLWSEFRSRFEDENGAVATEYVLLLALIALAITAGMVVLATAILDKFQASADCLNTGGPC